MSNVRPRDRDIAMVFQNYALYPQLTVAENMGFALKQQKVPKAERIERVREAARVLDLEPYLKRKPKHLSGGQRQRVAMGRAIVRRPAVYLMDEPLSNLDAKLRVQTRTEVVELQARLGVTTVYVTHDQVEAMTMGHRVAVLKDGVLAAVRRTRHALPRAGEPVRRRLHRLARDEPRRARRRPPARAGRHEAAARRGGRGRRARRRRPDHRRVPAGGAAVGDGPLRAQIRTVEDLGSEVFVHLLIEHGGKSVPLVAKLAPPFAGGPGEAAGLQITGTVHLFDGEGTRLASTTGSLA